MNTYSHSRLSTFEQCKLKYKYSYIDKLETEIENTVEAFMGDLVHQTLEKLYRDVKFLKLPALNKLLDFYNDMWKKNWNEAIIIVRREYNADNFRRMGEQFITDYYNSKKPFNQSRTLALETSKIVEISPGIMFHIRIDRLALDREVYEIHDYKTSNSLPTLDQIEKDRQLTLYSYGVKKLYPDARRIRQIWHYLAFNKDVIIERSEEEIEEARKKVLAIVGEIGKCSDWPTQVSALCDWCQFKPLCPQWKHLYEIEDKPADEYLKDDGVQLVNKFAALSEKVKNLEEEKERIRIALVNFAKKNNIEMVYGSDIRAAIKTYPKLSFPKKEDPLRTEFFKTLKTIGLWDQLAIADVYELTKLINNKQIHQDLIRILDKFIEKGSVDKIYLRQR